MSHWVRRYEWALPMFLAAHAAFQIPALSAPALWILLTWVPGRLLMLVTGIGLAWSPLARVILAVALSLAVSPLLLNPLWHWTNDAQGLLVPIWLVLTLVALLVHFIRPPPPQSSDTHHLFSNSRYAFAAAAIAAFVVVITIAPYWPRDAASGPVPSAIHDYIKQHAVLWSLEQRPLPLGNPFFAPDARQPVYYYHFFYLIPATVRVVVGGISINLAFAVQAAIVALTTAGLAAMFARRLFGGDAPALLAFALTTVVGGFDVIPMLLFRQPAITLDAWADTLVRVHSLLTQMVWTPQNVQGTTLVLLAALLLHEHGFTRIWLLLGPILGAALIGSTVWIAVAALPALALLVLLECVWPRRPGEGGGVQRIIVRLAAAIFIAAAMLALSLPTLRGYLEMSHRHGKSLTTDWTHQSHALLGRIAPPGVLANLLDLPWLLLIEFGPLVVLPLLLPRGAWRRAWHDPGMRLLMLGALVALVGFVTFRSHFTYNDFGQKIIMAAMICGAVLGAGCVGCVRAAATDSNGLKPSSAARTHPASPRWKIAILIAAIVLGAPVALWQSPLAAVRRFVPPDGPLARISVALAPDDAAAMRFIRDALSQGVVIQGDPGLARLTLQQLTDHQIGVMPLEQDTHVFLGPHPERQELACNELTTELATGDSAARLHEMLTSLGVTHVLLGEVERQKWSRLERFDDPMLFAPLFTSGTTHIYECR